MCWLRRALSCRCAALGYAVRPCHPFGLAAPHTPHRRTHIASEQSKCHNHIQIACVIFLLPIYNAKSFSAFDIFRQRATAPAQRRQSHQTQMNRNDAKWPRNEHNPQSERKVDCEQNQQKRPAAHKHRTARMYKKWSTGATGAIVQNRTKMGIPFTCTCRNI